jgi:hypothetical protein
MKLARAWWNARFGLEAEDPSCIPLTLPPM